MWTALNGVRWTDSRPSDGVSCEEVVVEDMEGVLAVHLRSNVLISLLDEIKGHAPAKICPATHLLIRQLMLRAR